MSDTPRTDTAQCLFGGPSADARLEEIYGDCLNFARQLERELIAACEERDMYSEVLDFLISKADDGYRIADATMFDDCPEHLRKRLEGK